MTFATRRSALALTQSRAFGASLVGANPGLELGELEVVTTGDRIQDRPLSEVGGKGLFVKEIEEALLEGRAEFAVHSIKDVPGFLPDGLLLACVPRREDPRDVLVSPKYGTLAKLPEGARVGTSSLRRAVALRAARPDLRIEPLRGNVDTRLRKAKEGALDAIVLACAGLTRLGMASEATEILSEDVCLPAIGQGALGIECKASDQATRDVLAKVHDQETSRPVFAERGVLIALEGDCKTPIAAFGQRDGDSLYLRAFVAEPDGTRFRRAERRVPWPTSDEGAHAIGFELGRELRGES